MKFLIKKLNLANDIYYNKNKELISNYEYDKLYDELLKLEKKLEIKFSNSPTQNIGFKVMSNLEKVKHDFKMLSLNKTKNIFEIEKFLGNKIGMLSYKLDGLTIILKYNNKNLEKVLTRGNGIIGENVTHNKIIFKNLPEKINFDGDLIVRGEAIILKSDFKKINDIDEKIKYKNPRNLCSGTIRTLDTKNILNRDIYFFAFEMLTQSNLNFNNSKRNKLEFLKKLGFDIVINKLVDQNNIKKNLDIFLKNLETYDFNADGLVLTFDDIKFSESLGITSKFPKDSIAFKWKDETKETKLNNIEWKNSRSGIITPVANFDSVDIEGTKVSKASLHNLNMIKDLKLGIGDKIKVYKANMIIPQISENLTRSNNIKIPEFCPACGQKTRIIINNKTKFLICENNLCIEKIIASLEHYTSRDAMNITGLSTELIRRLVDKNFLFNYFDIYNLKNLEQEIIYSGVLDNKDFSKNHKLYKNLLKSIEKSRVVQAYRFLYSLGIDNVGLNASKIICEKFNNNINLIIDSDLENLISIDSIGEITAISVINYFSNKKKLNVIKKILSVVKIKS
jgi:DNA ligase (NAD+)